MNPVIYSIQNPLGQKYIGSTINLANRRHHHRRYLRKGEGVNRVLQASWDAHGGENHVFSVVASVIDRTQLHLVEKQVMLSLGAELNVNMNPSPVCLDNSKKMGARRKLRTVSRSAICKRYYVPTHVYMYRRSKNWTVRQALNLAPPPQKKERHAVKKRYVTAGGRTLCMDEWSRLSGMPKPSITARLARGCTPEQAVGLEKTEREVRMDTNRAKAESKPKRPTFTVAGITGTLSDLARHFNVPDTQLRSRQRMGWPESDWLKPKYVATSKITEPELTPQNEIYLTRRSVLP